MGLDPTETAGENTERSIRGCVLIHWPFYRRLEGVSKGLGFLSLRTGVRNCTEVLGQRGRDLPRALGVGPRPRSCGQEIEERAAGDQGANYGSKVEADGRGEHVVGGAAASSDLPFMRSFTHSSVIMY